VGWIGLGWVGLAWLGESVRRRKYLPLFNTQSSIFHLDPQTLSHFPGPAIPGIWEGESLPIVAALLHILHSQSADLADYARHHGK